MVARCDLKRAFQNGVDIVRAGVNCNDSPFERERWVCSRGELALEQSTQLAPSSRVVKLAAK